jgi:hypothetical protein
VTTQLQKINKNNNGKHHPRADVDRLYVHRKKGGSGLLQLEAVHTADITKLVKHVERKAGSLTQLVRTRRRNIDSAVLQRARRLKTEVERETREIKGSIAEKTKEI